MCLYTFPGPVSHLTWIREYLYFLGGVSLNKSNSAGMIYGVQQDGQGLAPSAFGADACTKELRWATVFLAVQVQKGPKDQISLMFESSAIVLYSDTYDIMTWDILDLGDGKEILVIGRGSRSNLTGIYVIQDQDLRQLPYHGDAVAKFVIADAEIFYAAASDNTDLGRVLLIPKGADEKPWPTIVLHHGGPRTRVTLPLMFHFITEALGLQQQAICCCILITAGEAPVVKTLRATPEVE